MTNCVHTHTVHSLPISTLPCLGLQGSEAYLSEGSYKGLGLCSLIMVLFIPVQALCKVYSQGHIQAQHVQKPTAAPAEGLAPGP